MRRLTRGTRCAGLPWRAKATAPVITAWVSVSLRTRSAQVSTGVRFDRGAGGVAQEAIRAGELRPGGVYGGWILTTVERFELAAQGARGGGFGDCRSPGSGRWIHCRRNGRGTSRIGCRVRRRGSKTPCPGRSRHRSPEAGSRRQMLPWSRCSSRLCGGQVDGVDGSVSPVEAVDGILILRRESGSGARHDPGGRAGPISTTGGRLSSMVSRPTPGAAAPTESPPLTTWQMRVGQYQGAPMSHSMSESSVKRSPYRSTATSVLVAEAHAEDFLFFGLRIELGGPAAGAKTPRAWPLASHRREKRRSSAQP